MKRLLLLLPVLLLGGPLAAYLIVVSGGTEPAPSIPPVVIPDEGALPDAAAMERLAASDPVAFLKNCVRHYNHEVKGYTAVLAKHERIEGTLEPPELLRVWFREKPFSVLLRWMQGERRAKAALYVAGANDNEIVVLPAGLAGKLLLGKPIRLDLNSKTARAAGRYPLDQFGIKNGTLRTLAGWIDAQKRGGLHVEFLGKHKTELVGGRLCYGFHRRYDRPEPNGADDLVIYIDAQTYLQVGSVIKDRDGKLIGEYYFRDIRLNPTFPADQFEPSALSGTSAALWPDVSEPGFT